MINLHIYNLMFFMILKTLFLSSKNIKKSNFEKKVAFKDF